MEKTMGVKQATQQYTKTNAKTKGEKRYIFPFGEKARRKWSGYNNVGQGCYIVYEVGVKGK